MGFLQFLWPCSEFAVMSTPEITWHLLWVFSFLHVWWQTWNCLEMDLNPFPDWWIKTIASLISLLMFFLHGSLLTHTRMIQSWHVKNRIWPFLVVCTHLAKDAGKSLLQAVVWRNRETDLKLIHQCFVLYFFLVIYLKQLK